MATCRRFVSTVCSLLLSLSIASAAPAPRSLSFEDRVRAQEAIERVYYRHQVGATRPFEQAVTRELLERKVTETLERSVALERVWGRPVTSESLEREWNRIVENTRLPDRLREIGDALEWDPLLLLECVARPALVNRLLDDLYARDRDLHAETRAAAERLRDSLTRGDYEAAASIARVQEVLLKRVTTPDGSRSVRSTSGDASKLEVLELDPGTYRARRSRAPRSPGQVGEVLEHAGGFEIRVVLDEGSDHARIASFVVPKRSRELWWAENRSAFTGGFAPANVELTAEALRLHADATLGLRGSFDPTCVPDDTWDNGILEDPNPARDGHSAVWTGTEMILWGGGGLDSGLRYDPLLDSFSATSQVNAPSPRSFHTAVWTGSEMIVWGGWPLTTTGGRYDPAEDSWTPTSTVNAPVGRMDHTAVWTGHAMIVWGGSTGVTKLNTGGRYFPASDVWAEVPTSYAPSARDRHSAVWTGSEMIVWGGMAPSHVATGARYEPIQDRWTAMAAAGAPSARADHIALWTGTTMLVWGGSGQSGVVSTGSRYDPATNTWAAITNTGAPVAGGGEVAVWSGAHAEMIVWRGATPSAQGRYSPSSNSWSPMSTGPEAPNAISATAVWTGSEMIVWSPANGGRYDPTSNAWNATQQLTATAGPSDRSGHTAVWTGNEMIVWGGPNDAAPLGSRYDPLLETWTPVSAIGAPSARTGHTAVWTGNEMIVWGGDAAGSLQDSGGRYVPNGDTWQSTAVLDAPEARAGHVAVWTGDEMLVWGGFVSGDPMTQLGCESAHAASGASYDPDTDGWSALSTGGAPAPREAHGAVWTGTQMLVWGGRHWSWNAQSETCTQDVPLADGGRYELGSNTWSPISATGEPSARFGHTAVWTGTQMLVWGGDDGATMLDSGGEYGPSTNTWEPTSQEGAPAARSGHTAIWSGDEMVIWGGGSFLDSGGRYQPEWNLWRATSRAGAPTARDGHAAVWTGDEMIVWGGSEPGGGRYAIGHSDHDGDGIAEGCLACPAGPADDSDGDGHPCAADNCPFEPNPSQLDGDSDDWGDACDPCLGDPLNDTDGDLVCESVDNCPGAFNPTQADADGDLVGDACEDNDDDDAFADAQDNCPRHANDYQEDADGDGAGNACDPCPWDSADDADGDSICGGVDNCLATANPTQRDDDEDGTGDACDVCPSDPSDAVVGDGLCFAAEVRYPVGARPRSIAAADVNRDGFDDLATANYANMNTSRYVNDGSGGFVQPSSALLHLSPVFIRTGDLNADGNPDHVAISSRWNPPASTPPGIISVFMGTGSGFQPRKDHGAAFDPTSLAIADFDLDGHQDVIVANRELPGFSFFKGTAPGNLYAPIHFTTAFNRKPELVLADDVDGDQLPDLVVSVFQSNLIQLYHGTGNLSFTFIAEENVGTGRIVTGHALGDFDEDRTLDLAVAHTNGAQTDHRLLFLRGTGTGDFVVVSEIQAGRASTALEVADFNQDGHADLVMANPADWDLSILTGDGAFGFSAETRLPVGVSPVGIALGDLTGDGRPSLASANFLSDDISVLINRGRIGGRPPIADAGPNGIFNVPADSPTGATVTLDGSGSRDADSTPGTANDIVLYEWIRNLGEPTQSFLGTGKTIEVVLPLYTSRVTLRTTDRRGLTDTDLVTVTVVPTAFLPDLEVQFDPPTLWPPDHRMVAMHVSLIPGPSCPTPAAVLTSVTSNEPADAAGPADGETPVDIEGVSPGTHDHDFGLRAERSSLSPGRSYFVTYLVSCNPNSQWPLQFRFDVPFERDGTSEPMRILLDETTEGTLVAWTPVPGAEEYDVIRGSLDELQVSPDAYDLGQVTCIEAGSTDTNTAGFEDPSAPLAGELFFYLVRYRDEGRSGYGTASAVKPRLPNAGDCPVD